MSPKLVPVVKFDKPETKPEPVKTARFYALVECRGGGFQVYEKETTLEGAVRVDAPDLRSIAISRVARILGRQ